MKKLLCIAISVVGILAAQAQDTKVSLIKFGVKAGANFAKFSGDDSEDAKTKVGFHFGPMVNIPVSSMFSIQPEVLYSAEGAKYEDGSDEIKAKFSYINVPVLLQYNNPSGFFAEAGPQIGFLVSAKTKYNDEDEEDVKDEFKGINFGLGIGLGFKSKAGIGFGARYNFGLSNIIDDDDADLNQNNISVGLFYMFGGQK